MDQYTVVVLVTTIGFFVLAFILLAPVYFFLKREERLGEEWTQEIEARRLHERPPISNGSTPTTSSADESESHDV